MHVCCRRAAVTCIEHYTPLFICRLLKRFPVTPFRFICDDNTAATVAVAAEAKKPIHGKSQSQFQQRRNSTTATMLPAAEFAQDDTDRAAHRSISFDAAACTTALDSDHPASLPSLSSSDAHVAPPLLMPVSAESSELAAHQKGIHASEALLFRSAVGGGRTAVRRVADFEGPHGAVNALDADTRARLAALEARTSTLRGQLDQMLEQMELKDKAIEGAAAPHFTCCL